MCDAASNLDECGLLKRLLYAPSEQPEENTAALIYNQMVVAEWTDEAVDHLFHALADATRRDILRRSVRGELSVSQLAEAYPMSFAAVQKHIAVLERAGPVTKERRGREQLVSTDPDAARRARQDLDQLEQIEQTGEHGHDRGSAAGGRPDGARR